MYGHMVIADISGYTRFLTDNELEHANGIIGELLNAVIGAIQAPLTVSGIEGDAVFMYGVMPENMRGQAVLESVEILYCSFAGALETMVLNTTCNCNACASIGSLGLKIIMHCGQFIKTEIGGRETLSGPDVILTHRLLKNRIRESTGIADYMFVTQQCVDDLDVPDIVSGWSQHTEEYEHVGEVHGYVSSLLDVWSLVRRQNGNRVAQTEAWIALTAHSEAPPAIVWDHLIDPVKRTTWFGVNDNEVVGRAGGRIGAGTEYHCAHGENNDIMIITVLGMQPLDHLTMLAPVGEGMALRYTDYVIPSGTGTRIVHYSAPLYSTETGEPFPDEVLVQMKEILGANYQRNLERLVGQADRDFAKPMPA